VPRRPLGQGEWHAPRIQRSDIVDDRRRGPNPAACRAAPRARARVAGESSAALAAHGAGPRGAAARCRAHIEFNAINLALDAIWRFERLPDAYYREWLRVASEEAHHFSLLAEQLATLGHAYGDFDAHDGLWSMVEKTKHDIVARMALVPRTLEAVASMPRRRRRPSSRRPVTRVLWKF
jgi:hypothetical protein